MGSKLRPVKSWLRRRNRGIWIAHICIGYQAALQNELGLHSKKRGLPYDQVRKLAHFYGTNLVSDAVSYCWIDRIFRNVSHSAKVGRAQNDSSRRPCHQEPVCRTGSSSYAPSARSG